MNISKLIISVYILALFLTSCNSQKKPLYTKIPEHQLFISKNIVWEDFNEFPDYRKKLGKNNDTMVILTKDRIILITGQYGMLPEDSIVMPSSGEFGINFELLENTKYKVFEDTIITIGQKQFIREPMAEFQWWNEILPVMHGYGKGSVIVSGP